MSSPAEPSRIDDVQRYLTPVSPDSAPLVDGGAQWMPCPDSSDDRQVAWVRVKYLGVDLTMQRDIKPARLKTLRERRYDPLKAEAVTAFRKANGRLVVVEGQGRVVTLHDRPEAPVITILLPGYLSDEDAVKLAREMSASRMPYDPEQNWASRRNEGEPRTLAADQLLHERGWILQRRGKALDIITSAASMQNIIWDPAFETPGQAKKALAEVLDLIADAWPTVKGRFSRTTIQAIFLLWLPNRGSYDRRKLIRAMSQNTPDIWGTLATSGSAANPSSAWRMAQYIQMGYNSGLTEDSPIKLRDPAKSIQRKEPPQ